MSQDHPNLAQSAMIGCIPTTELHITVARGNKKWTKVVCSCVSKFKILLLFMLTGLGVFWKFLPLQFVSCFKRSKNLVIYLFIHSSFCYWSKSYWCTFAVKCTMHIFDWWLVFLMEQGGRENEVTYVLFVCL